MKLDLNDVSDNRKQTQAYVPLSQTHQIPQNSSTGSFIRDKCA